MFCTQCGVQARNADRFCSQCGHRLVTEEDRGVDASRSEIHDDERHQDIEFANHLRQIVESRDPIETRAELEGAEQVPKIVVRLAGNAGSENEATHICTNCETKMYFSPPIRWMIWTGWGLAALSVLGPFLIMKLPYPDSYWPVALEFSKQLFFMLPVAIGLVIVGYLQRIKVCPACHSRKVTPIPKDQRLILLDELRRSKSNVARLTGRGEG